MKTFNTTNAGISACPAIVLQAGTNFSATKNGEFLGPAPNETVAALALLVAEGPKSGWNRQALAAKLFPKCADRSRALAALRQSLKRLKTWLGDDALRSDKRTIGAGGNWTLNLSDEPILYGIGNPIFDPFRVRNSRAWNKEALPEANRLFLETVQAVSRLDVDEARGLVAHATGLVLGLTPPVALALLKEIAPRRDSDPFAYEHFELQATLLSATARISDSDRMLRRALRIAHANGRGHQIERARSFLMFNALEQGDYHASQDLLSALAAPAVKTRLLCKNAQAAYYWSLGQLSEAIEVMRSAVPDLQRASRADRAHFWSNAAVLASEALDTGFFDEADKALERVLIPEHDWSSRFRASLGRLLMSAREDAEVASHKLSDLAKTLSDSGWRLGSVYALEGQCQALARAGNLAEAGRVWCRIAAFRQEQGWRITQRVLNFQPL
jgi:tetratricopeptide (TPR) repeat protein